MNGLDLSAKLNGIDLFSGIGGISFALKSWIQPTCYCECDPYCQGVLLSHMASDRLFRAPIWDNICTFGGHCFREAIDIIYGGFPCQGISVAGHGKGLADERSGLFWEIIRISKEIKPKFIFLENVPAITTRGGGTVVQAITEMGYDCRWCVISAASIGAPHKRERWFLLAHAQHNGSSTTEKFGSSKESISNSSKGKNSTQQSKGMDIAQSLAPESITNSTSARCERHGQLPQRIEEEYTKFTDPHLSKYWEENNSPICGVDDGIPNRVHRIRALGNSVVPSQIKKAFKILMGIKNE